jgi:hypothetical protein
MASDPRLASPRLASILAMNTRLTISLLLAASLLPRAAFAQSDADRATARALSAEGHKALDKKDYATAAERFARADGLVHAPTLLLGLARAQAGLGKLVSAQETYRRILREGVAPGSPPPFFKALAEAKKESSAIEPRLPHVVIEVKGPSTPKVTIDGHDVPLLALGVKRPTDPGSHVVRATADGFEPAEKTLTLDEGKGETVTLELAKAPPAAAPPPIAPSVTLAPPPPPDAPAPTSSTQRTLGIVALSVGAAGLALGGVTGSLVIATHGSLKDKCMLDGGRCPRSVESELATYNTLGAVSTVGFIAGGALAATGVILIVTAPRPTPGAWISPVVGPGYAGVKGRF